jgi:catechol 2,3-dioxygenase-like lactoylglutathione lyase family enzyme
MPDEPLFERIDTVILRVRDYEAAADWYADRLGLQPLHTDPVEGLVVLPFDGHSLTLWQLKAGETLPPRGTCVPFPIFVTADAAALHAELQERDVTVDQLQEGGGVRSFTFWDLDGNRLEACQVLVGRGAARGALGLQSTSGAASDQEPEEASQ